MYKGFKKVLCVLMAFVMVVGGMPVSAEPTDYYHPIADDNFTGFAVTTPSAVNFECIEVEAMSIAARPGEMRDPRNAPVWGVDSYTFRIDAQALSNLVVDHGTMAVLDFTIAGGTSAHEVGFAGPIAPGLDPDAEWTQRSPWGGIETFRFTRNSAVTLTFSAGPNFRVEGESGSSVAIFLSQMNNLANNPNNREYLDYNAPGRNGWNWRATPSDWDFPMGYQHQTFWRQIQLDLFAGAQTWAERAAAWPSINGSISGEFPALEGWIDVTIGGVRASQSDAEMSIVLRQGGGSMLPTNTALVENAQMFLGWGSGVNIRTESIVPVASTARLSGIKIEEAVVGRFLSPDPVHTNNGFHVRLVAPRGFNWDMQDVFATGNIAFGNNNRRESFNAFGGIAVVDTSFWHVPANRHWNAPTSNPFANSFTDRNELILYISMPPRGTSFTARTTPAEVTIHGLSLMPAALSPTTGDMAIDVYVGAVSGNMAWQAPPGPDAHGSGTLGVLDRDPGRQVRISQPGSYWTERTNEASEWRERGLVVASLDLDSGLAVSGPVALQTIRSGGWSVAVNDLPMEYWSSGLDFSDSNRWLNGAEHTIRISEQVAGTMFSSTDNFRIVPAEGVRIVNARARAGREGANTDIFGWGGMYWRNDFFVPAMYEFNNDGSLSFATRPLNPDAQFRLRRLDIGVLLSVEAGFEARFGNEIAMRVYRNNEYVGTAIVANATDPIIIQSNPVEITRETLTTLSVTPVGSFSVTEASPHTFNFNDEIRFRLQATRNGVPVNYGAISGMSLYLGEPTVNTSESFLTIAPLTAAGATGFRITAPSYRVAGEISFDNARVMGPTLPGIEWQVVVYGPGISANSHHIMGSTDFIGGDTRINLPEEYWLSDYALRGRFYGMPYSAEILIVSYPVNENIPVITNANAPSGAVNTDYSFRFAATGNPAPSWSYTGDLPTGLTLNAQGLLSGTPTQSGNFTFTVRAYNVEGYEERQITVEISQAPAPPVDLTAPALTISTTFADQGDEVEVHVRISNNPGFASMFMRLDFPAELTLTGYALSHHSLYENFETPEDLSTVGNYVYMGWAGRTANITHNGTLLTLTFSVCDDMETNRRLPITVTFENALTGEEYPRNTDYEELQISTINGEVRVQPARIGDTGGSGRVTSASATLLARYLVGQYVTFDRRAADINCDGVVNTLDLIRLARALAGHFPTLCPHDVCDRCR
ncbi:MAG: putative Ig domain-containing protein [Defluviitaleaceae bacterium]|nr:putative Ig domain-containing protein [Defluviitaleaceae bacterium]MCL2261903.1 putative Ig domain-containing protein [Defluviitaleaceae bacterium]